MVLNLPLPVFGVVSISGTAQAGVQVNLRNNRTSETVNVLTNTNGVYVLDAANLSSGYENTDSLTSFVLSGLYEGETTVNVSDPEHEADIVLTVITDTQTITYATVQDIFEELDDKTASDISAGRIVKAIQRAEELIDERTERIWKTSSATTEYYDFHQYNSFQSPESLQMYGGTGVVRGDYGRFNTGRNKFRLNHSPVITITSLSKNLAGSTGTDSWSALTEQEGSGGDFIVDKVTGYVTFLKSTPRYGSRSIKVVYTHGVATTPNIITSLCAKLAAKDIIGTKAFGSQFTSVDDIRIDVIQIRKGSANTVDFLNNLDKQINQLWTAVGSLTVESTG